MAEHAELNLPQMIHDRIHFTLAENRQQTLSEVVTNKSLTTYVYMYKQCSITCMYLLNEFGLDVHCVAGQEGTEGGEGGGDEKTRDHITLEQ